ncbi:hypothetical protein QR680_001557 [Steinernema hermaphroditum]|uniref:Sushi domain-containing protein n=1 Tax=Steinernema hermaphroditum TaxID=289476 RepID=A0AA39GYT9_9BILA|nr:hypothetical protein QR680_001557 [Steinernema hermaphroditum]
MTITINDTTTTTEATTTTTTSPPEVKLPDPVPSNSSTATSTTTPAITSTSAASVVNSNSTTSSQTPTQTNSSEATTTTSTTSAPSKIDQSPNENSTTTTTTSLATSTTSSVGPAVNGTTTTAPANANGTTTTIKSDPSKEDGTTTTTIVITSTTTSPSNASTSANVTGNEDAKPPSEPNANTTTSTIVTTSSTTSPKGDPNVPASDGNQGNTSTTTTTSAAATTSGATNKSGETNTTTPSKSPGIDGPTPTPNPNPNPDSTSPKSSDGGGAIGGKPGETSTNTTTNGEGNQNSTSPETGNSNAGDPGEQRYFWRFHSIRQKRDILPTKRVWSNVYAISKHERECNYAELGDKNHNGFCWPVIEKKNVPGEGSTMIPVSTESEPVSTEMTKTEGNGAGTTTPLQLGNCPNIPIDGGRARFQSLNGNSSLMVVCNEGYAYLDGSVQRIYQCFPNATWSSNYDKEEECKAYCDTGKLNFNNTVQTLNRTRVYEDTEIPMTCETNYVLPHGAASIEHYCEWDGTFGETEDWSCKPGKAQCPKPSINLSNSEMPPKDSAYLSGSQKPGTLIMHICQGGTLFAKSKSPVNIYKCMDSGKWSSNYESQDICEKP